MALPSTQADWQDWIDTQFPDQVNCRITADAEDNEIDFVATGISVIGMIGTLPVILFWEPDSSKDFYLRPTEIKIKQTSPRVLVQLTDESSRVWLFWPRPEQGDSAAQKDTERGMASTLSGAYFKSGVTST